MDIRKTFNPDAIGAWSQFVQREQLSIEQQDLFASYLSLLLEWNDKMNLTRITSIEDVIAYHFQDSLRLGDFLDFTHIKSMCDVGSGAGFPGIALKIKYPHLTVTLLEVNAKKVSFLRHVIDVLHLASITVSDYDWRTFLRVAPTPIDLFCARASLQPDELIRVFKPTCAYTHATLVYWASAQWHVEAPEQPFLTADHTYIVGDKTRRYIIFSRPKEVA